MKLPIQAQPVMRNVSTSRIEDRVERSGFNLCDILFKKGTIANTGCHLLGCKLGTEPC